MVMLIKRSILFFLMIGTLSIQAESLKSVVESVLDSSPTVQERLGNYRATRSAIDVAEAGYYPTLDIKSGVGRKGTGQLRDSLTKESYDVFQNSLVLRQNIFSGFSTHEQVQYQKMRTLAAAYSYLEKANDVTLQAITVYLELQKNQALLKNAQKNVSSNEEIYKKVRKAFKAGLSTMSEVSKIHASLSLAKSNMMVQNNRLRTAQYNFQRVVGRKASISKLQKVNFKLKLPTAQRKAEVYALEYNPSLLVGKYNIKGAEALYRESKSAFMPKVDFEMTQNYNKNFNQFTGEDDRLQALLLVSYNLFNGGADEAKKKIKLSELSQEVSVVNDLRRQVIENVDLSWSFYLLAQEQMPFLRDYKKHSKKTLKFYTKEYTLGERSMLDLISAENDLKRSKDELISAQYALLLSKYRIMDSMGLTMVAVLGNEQEYYHRVGIGADTRHIKEDENYGDLMRAMKKDKKHHYTSPISRDKDKDRIPDMREISPNSKYINSVTHTGRRTK